MMFKMFQLFFSGLHGSKKSDAPVSNRRTYRWICAIILACCLRLHRGGVSSIINALEMAPSHYCALDDVFRSAAVDLGKLVDYQLNYITENMTPFLTNGRYTFTADGVYTTCEGRRTPGATRCHKDSGTESKPSSFFGKQAFAIDMIMQGNNHGLYSVPVEMRLAYGLAPICDWEGTPYPDADKSLEMQETLEVIRLCNEHNLNAYLLSDRASMNGNVFTAILTNNEDTTTSDVDLITVARKNAVAYYPPRPEDYAGRGPHPKRGKKVHLSDLAKCSDGWHYARVWAYGRKQKCMYKCVNLLWGDDLHLLRFVIVKGLSRDGTFVLVSTNTTLSPVTIISAYSRRFLCEERFKQYKHTFKGFDCHFWSKSHPYHSHLRPKDQEHILSLVTDKKEREAILKALRANDLYLELVCISQMIVQQIAMEQERNGVVQSFTKKRSKTAVKVSEEDVCNFFSKEFHLVLKKYEDDEIIQFIMSMGGVEDEAAIYALL